MRFLLIIILSVVVLPGSPAMAAPEGGSGSWTHMMWHFTPSGGATPELVARVEKAVREYFQKQRTGALMNGVTMDSVLLVEGNEKYLRCGTGAECLAGLGGAAGARFVIAGEVGLSTGRTRTHLVLVDVSAKKVISSASVGSNGAPSGDKLRELTIAMFEPERYKGSIEIETSVTGAEVLIDGKKMGVAPLVGPLAAIAAGEHLVEIKKPGHEPFSRTVRVPIGKTVRLVALLPRIAIASQARPFYRDWPFWTAAGAGAVAMVVAGILNHSANGAQESADNCRQGGLTCGDSYQDKADSRYLQAYVVYGLGGAGLLAAGLIAVIDLATAEPAPTAEPAFDLGLAPLPGGMALDATFRF
ncbi:MAG TPA: PEGA domain-containing protein [Myxococcota bacterium]|nr:PEGA domain-containing protein [Myxococcota bacterium]